MTDPQPVSISLAGCWIDGTHGMYGELRLIDIAVEHGYELEDEEQQFVNEFRSGDYKTYDPPLINPVTLMWAREMCAAASKFSDSWAPTGHDVYEMLDGLVDGRYRVIPDVTYRERIVCEQITGIAEHAMLWMNLNIAPKGHYFDWHDGEFMLWSIDDWHDASGM